MPEAKGLSDPYQVQIHNLDAGHEASYQQTVPLYHNRPPTDREKTRWSLWSWSWEFGACLVAIITLGGIIAVLRIYDGKTQPNWPAGINLNAIIALLTTLMKAAMATYIAEALSQLKWSWFREARTLSDLAALDSASRGAWGSAQLLVQYVPRCATLPSRLFQANTRHSHLASLGAFVLVFAAAIGPFTQQVIDVRSRSVSRQGGAAIRVCNTSMYEDWWEGQAPGMNLVPLETTGAIYNGIMQTSLNDQSSVTCPTGNCTFAPYQSLGFCGKCGDLTSALTLTSSDETTYSYNYSLPNGLFFNTTGSMPYTIKAATNVNLVRLNASGLPLILNFSAITTPGKTLPPKATAMECVFYFCVSTYQATVKQGDLMEQNFPTTTISNHSTTNLTLNTVASAQPCLNDGQCNYAIQWLSILAMRNTLSPLVSGFGTLPVSNRPYFTSDTLRALYGGSGNLTQISGTFASLAAALSTNARNRVCQGTVPGDAWANESYIHVRWLWMLLPIVLVVLSILFLIVTVVHTRNQYIWKSSPLALLCADLQIDGSVEPLKSGKIDPGQKELDEMAKVSKVRLEAGSWGSLMHGHVVHRA
ncbi:DUF3176 domain-containing protein [Aspergillus thermomutatus]|uniref:Uncharacterized protein n=1 Tax=Aspergillus thermomutatus TaxID=41047 RepID=A0A397HF88_ASPTH|nr:uncharacterized protein CDV56_107278 [Aspergillus thermomutatus]RHZ61811.1 hypothetical protein CDV56_107278 [Aspergillus thermomutatus]